MISTVSRANDVALVSTTSASASRASAAPRTPEARAASENAARAFSENDSCNDSASPPANAKSARAAARAAATTPACAPARRAACISSACVSSRIAHSSPGGVNRSFSTNPFAAAARRAPSPRKNVRAIFTPGDFGCVASTVACVFSRVTSGASRTAHAGRTPTGVRSEPYSKKSNRASANALSFVFFSRESNVRPGEKSEARFPADASSSASATSSHCATN